MPSVSDRRVIIVGDTEYTTFGPTRATGWTQAHHHKEIVQIAAVRLDLETGCELATFDRLVRPAINPQLTRHFVTLTGIGQPEVDRDGAPFVDRLAEYLAFCGDDPIWVFDADGEVFRENCALNGLPFPFVGAREVFRVKPRLAGWGYDPEAYSSGTLCTAIGLPLDGRVHNALHDVRSMAAFLRHVHAGRTSAS